MVVCGSCFGEILGTPILFGHFFIKAGLGDGFEMLDTDMCKLVSDCRTGDLCLFRFDFRVSSDFLVVRCLDGNLMIPVEGVHGASANGVGEDVIKGVLGVKFFSPKYQAKQFLLASVICCISFCVCLPLLL